MENVKNRLSYDDQLDQFAKYSDEALIDAYHRNTGSGAFTSAHLTYLSALMKSLANRPFDSSIILDLDQNGFPVSLKMKCRVKLDRSIMKLVLDE
jgi:hypothetical protein